MLTNAGGKSSRRDFIRTLAGAAAIAGIKGPFDYARAAITPGEKGIYITKIYRTKPSVGGIVIRVETNKGIVGYGECRDLDSGAQSALTKYGTIAVGMNPTQVDKIWNAMWAQYTDPANMANTELNGGSAMAAIEIACWDITGKIYNVPIWKLMGPKYNDSIRMYADTDSQSSSLIQARIQKGFTWFKTDMYMSNIAQGNYTTSSSANSYGYREITLSQSGLDQMAAAMQSYRDVLVAAGEPFASAPISSDHYQGYNATNQLSVASATALANTLRPISKGGWVEDIIDWWVDGCSGAPLKAVTAATDMNILTGEDMVGITPFKNFADSASFDFMHPEPTTAGGIHVTRLAANYALTKGVKTAFHNSSGPIAMCAYAHCAAGIKDFLAMEFHHLDVTYHDDLVDGIPKPMFSNSFAPAGYFPVPEGPGLGVTPNQAAFSAHGAGTWTQVV